MGQFGTRLPEMAHWIDFEGCLSFIFNRCILAVQLR